MITNIIIYGGFAGITVFIGGILAYMFKQHMKEGMLKDETAHAFMSFGSGVMLSALALVLVPKGMAKISLIPILITFIVGTVIFMYIDRYLASKGGQTATVLAMMMDFVPESIALGAVFATEPSTATLLAVFIGLQNLPEAFNAFRDLSKSGVKVKKILTIFFFLSFAGIVGSLFGHFVLSAHQAINQYLMIFASGGILYLLIQDIIPDSKMEKSYMISVFASLGFLVGVIGEKLT